MYTNELKWCPGCKNACPVGNFNCPMGQKYLDDFNAKKEKEAEDQARRKREADERNARIAAMVEAMKNNNQN